MNKETFVRFGQYLINLSEISFVRFSPEEIFISFHQDRSVLLTGEEARAFEYLIQVLDVPDGIQHYRLFLQKAKEQEVSKTLILPKS